MAKDMKDTFAGAVWAEIETIDFYQWSPGTPEENNKPEQVHMVVKLVAPGNSRPIHLLMRFKSPATISEVIDQLTMHRNEVWPK
jgi:hypothetical protein